MELDWPRALRWLGRGGPVATPGSIKRPSTSVFTPLVSALSLLSHFSFLFQFSTIGDSFGDLSLSRPQLNHGIPLLSLSFPLPHSIPPSIEAIPDLSPFNLFAACVFYFHLFSIPLLILHFNCFFPSTTLLITSSIWLFIYFLKWNLTMAGNRNWRFLWNTFAGEFGEFRREDRAIAQRREADEARRWRLRHQKSRHRYFATLLRSASLENPQWPDCCVVQTTRPA